MCSGHSGQTKRVMETNDLKHTCDPRPADTGPLAGRIKWLIEMEARSGSMDHPSPLYVSRMLHAPLGEVEACMKEMEAADQETCKK